MMVGGVMEKKGVASSTLWMMELVERHWSRGDCRGRSRSLAWQVVQSLSQRLLESKGGQLWVRRERERESGSRSLDGSDGSHSSQRQWLSRQHCWLEENGPG